MKNLVGFVVSVYGTVVSVMFAFGDVHQGEFFGVSVVASMVVVALTRL